MNKRSIQLNKSIKLIFRNKFFRGNGQKNEFYTVLPKNRSK
jgi:hypothetical protein